MGELPLTRVVGVVLAAGAGRRMGQPKAGLVVDDERLLDRAINALRNGGCDDVLAVVRPGVYGPFTVANSAADTGMRSSLNVALDNVAAPDVGLAVLLVDTPGIGADAVAAVVQHWRSSTQRIAVATFAGRRGHPTVMDRQRWAAAVAVAGPDEGARAYLLAHPADVDEVPVAGDPFDLDRPADLARWAARKGSARPE